MQKKQIMQFAVVKEQNGIIQKIGKSSVLVPKTNFKGEPDSIKWYPDKPKQESKQLKDG